MGASSRIKQALGEAKLTELRHKEDSRGSWMAGTRFLLVSHIIL